MFSSLTSCRRTLFVSRAGPVVRKGTSYKGRVVDALVETAEEGRGQRRNAPGSCKQAVIRGSPNRETGQESCPVTGEPIHNSPEGTGGTETSKYPEEKKTIVIP